MATRTRTRQAQPKPDAPAGNPRTLKSKERLARATELLSAKLPDDEWHSSNELHRELAKEVSDGLFGRAKQALAIEHRRVRREDGGTEYQWRLPAKK
jgi:hypothetical protein